MRANIKNGNQQIMKEPMIMPSVLVVLCSREEVDDDDERPKEKSFDCLSAPVLPHLECWEGVALALRLKKDTPLRSKLCL